MVDYSNPIYRISTVPFIQGESARASLKGRDSRSLGVLVDLPGQKPLYLGASLDNGANRDINMRLNPL